MSARMTALRLGYEQLLKPVLFRVGGGDPEAAHEFLIRSLARVSESPAALDALRRIVGSPADPVTVAGIRFPGRVGVAAGLDKDGAAARAWAALGFGHAEVGTVTAHPQPGNDRPRMFRLRDSRAVINRMGFNNHGARALAARLNGWGVRRGEASLGIPLGISIGKTKVTPVAAAVEDYLTSLRALAGYADYVAVNVSSPNTPGLRSLQTKAALAELTRALVTEAHSLADPNLGPVPVFVKVAPDLSDGELDDVLTVCTDSGIAAMIVGNTTVERTGLAPADRRLAGEAGGLSGAPLTARARDLVGRVCRRSELPVVGVGGIMTPADAFAMFDAGAVLVQVYTGYIYAGAALVAGINARRIG